MSRRKKHSVLYWLPEVIVILAGLALLGYPTISGWVNSKSQAKLVADYQQAVDEADENRIKTEYKFADDFNSELFKNNGTTFAEYPENLKKTYWSDWCLNGVIGYITIPKINVDLPIKRGIDDATLMNSCGHMEGSSLPFGGVNTHTVLSGHRGLPSAKLFTDLDQLAVGDKFFIHVLDKVLAYQIIDIETILPEDVDSLGIHRGEDLATLVTCTPYGINTHRLLLTGTRVKYTPEIENDIKAVGKVTSHAAFVYYLLAGAAVILLLIIILVPRYYKKKNEKNVS